MVFRSHKSPRNKWNSSEKPQNTTPTNDHIKNTNEQHPTKNNTTEKLANTLLEKYINLTKKEMKEEQH